MSETFTCPRAEGLGSVFHYATYHEWRKDGTCSFCGSMSPDALMAGLREGRYELGPTDKNYKAYVNHVDGAYLGKFYFQHFSDAQRAEFIQMHNDRKLKIGYPGHFYVMPFFCKLADG